MPVVIGAKPESSFADPVGLLQDCHRRIERFLSVLSQVSGRASLSAEERQSLEAALRYFREAAPRHTADEEESLFPRLRAGQTSESKAALAKIDALENDHAQAGRLHAEVEKLGQKRLAGGSLAAEESRRFSDLVADLVQLYTGHIAVEENEVFPLAASMLDQSQRASVGAEMAARRAQQGSASHG